MVQLLQRTQTLVHQYKHPNIYLLYPCETNGHQYVTILTEYNDEGIVAWGGIERVPNVWQSGLARMSDLHLHVALADKLYTHTGSISMYALSVSV